MFIIGGQVRQRLTTSRNRQATAATKVTFELECESVATKRSMYKGGHTAGIPSRAPMILSKEYRASKRADSSVALRLLKVVNPLRIRVIAEGRHIQIYTVICATKFNVSTSLMSGKDPPSTSLIAHEKGSTWRQSGIL